MLGEALEIGEADTEVEIIRAGLNNIFPAAGALRGNQRLEVCIEQRRPQFVDRGEQILAAGLIQRMLQLIGRESRQEFLRGQLVVIAVVGPEQLGEVEYLAVNSGIDFSLRRDHCFQNALLLQAEARHLIVDDGIDGDGSLGQPVSQRLLFWRKAGEAVGFHLDDRSAPHAVHQG